MSEEHRQRVIRTKLARLPDPSQASLPTGFAFGPFPRGAIVEIFGASGCGKTSVALTIVGRCQAAGFSCAWIDADHTFDPAHAAELGVNLERLPVAQPQSAEQAFAMMAQLAASGAVDLLVVDSAAALVPALELETAIGESGPGLQTRVFSSGLRRLAQTLARSGASAVFLNQTRMRRNEEESTAGGPPLKLYAALRIELAGTRFRVLKNKAGGAFREGELRGNSMETL